MAYSIQVMPRSDLRFDIIRNGHCVACSSDYLAASDVAAMIEQQERETLLEESNND